ncbi:MAG: hypothetical protein HY706_18590 [Candidatus Hydrogenedentes bacterium]|nr:hypothetical protein [Candidatus Hydrogenedentota bacterium]
MSQLAADSFARFEPSSQVSSPGFEVVYEPPLVEEAVLRAIQGREEEPHFRSERDRIYELIDADQRESRFLVFHREWFTRLSLHRPVERALDERPILSTSARRCLIATAKTRKQEGAELFVAPEVSDPNSARGRVIAVRLRPNSFLFHRNLLVFLRHEFLHIADMLDPRFEYLPSLDQFDLGATLRTVVQERYRVLWDTFIDGRLVLEGKLNDHVRNLRLREFARMFPSLGDRTPEVFARIFDRSDLTHPELISAAAFPERLETLRG